MRQPEIEQESLLSDSHRSGSNLSLKLICVTCFLIMAVDTMVLLQTIKQYRYYEEAALPEVFRDCYQPQIVMRVVFTFYAINASLICFLLTLCLLVTSSSHEQSLSQERVLSAIFSYTYFLFGPVLLLCGVVSLGWAKSLCLYECTPDAILTEGGVSMLDLLMVLGSLAFASAVTFLMSMQDVVNSV